MLDCKKEPSLDELTDLIKLPSLEKGSCWILIIDLNTYYLELKQSWKIIFYRFHKCLYA